MRFFALTCCIALVLMGCAPKASKITLTPEQVARAGIDHQTDINRILDLMSSPDLPVRVSGLRQALFYAGDRNLRQLALSMAFASSDPNLRSEALLGAITTTSNLPIRFVRYTTRSHYLSDRIGNEFLVYVSHPANASSEFMTRTEYSSSKTDSSGKKINMVQPGSVSENYIKFRLDLNEIGGTDCMVALTLDPAGSAMHGTMTCKNNEGYAIASSALN